MTIDNGLSIYCVQVPEWNNGLSTEVYCQNVNNRKHTQSSYLYEMEKGASEQDSGERESVCVFKGARIAAK